MKHFKIALVSLSLVVAISCENSDDTDVNVGENQLLIHTAFESSSFLGTHEGLNNPEYTNSEAFEEVAYPYTYHFNNYVFVSPNFYGDVVKRYRLDETGNLTTDGQMVMEENSFPSNIYFTSETKAYISLKDKAKVVVFNPTTLEMTGEIDLLGTEYAIGTDNNPDPGAIIEREGKLFIALQQNNSFATSENGAYVLVVDESSLTIEKMISDTRLDWVGRPGMQETFTLVENGDIYVYCLGSFGYVQGQHHGFLRIKNGETEFDPGYVFNMTDLGIDGVEGGVTSHVNQAYYDGGNIMYVTAKAPALALDQDFFRERPFYSLKLDLINKTAEKLDIPLTNFYSGDITKLDEQLIFSVSSETAVGLYSYDPGTGQPSSTPGITVDGDPIYVMAIK
ncbi:MAG: DUF4374 domain-containing protein [Cytophagales bacterium]|nr:DUF4374 domain-containing protein [Cytophagales bacterium]